MSDERRHAGFLMDGLKFLNPSRQRFWYRVLENIVATKSALSDSRFSSILVIINFFLIGVFIGLSLR